MNLQLIIPMSGIGRRFLNAGYKIPKPLIKVDNIEIIAHVSKIFPEITSIIFICNEDHINNKNLDLKNKLSSLHPRTEIVSIKAHKKGPIHAVLEAINFIDLSMPTIVNYCDFFCLFDFNKFKSLINKENPDGCIFTYKGFHPHMLGNTNYAYVCKKNNNVIDIQEKEPYTSEPMNEEASSGSYYFKDGSIMKKFFKKTIEKDLNVNGEYYVSLSYRLMIEEGKKVKTFLIDYFMQWGTPADLEDYQYYSNLFKSLTKTDNYTQKKYEGNLIMPMAGEGARFMRYGFKKPKPLIEVAGIPIFQKAIQDLPLTEKLKFIIRRNINNFDELYKFIKDNFKNADLQIINSKTQGQAETCYLGLDNIDLQKPLIISACDMGIIYDEKVYDDLFHDNSIDLIVWGCRNFPGAIKNPNMYGWIDEKHKIIKKISVKEALNDPKNDPCIVGTFTYKKGLDFLNSAKAIFNKNDRINGEFYIDQAINECISWGLKVVLMEVDYFLCWGTPDDLLTFNYWEKCFHKWEKHSYNEVYNSKKK